MLRCLNPQRLIDYAGWDMEKYDIKELAARIRTERGYD